MEPADGAPCSRTGSITREMVGLPSADSLAGFVSAGKEEIQETGVIMTKAASRTYAPEVRERAARMVFEHAGDHASQWATIGSIAAKIGCTAETLRGWVRQAERDQGKGLDRQRTSGGGSRRWSARTANCAKPTRSFARQWRISPRRSSTARSGNDRLHRRAPRRPRGRADLPGSADRPVDLPCPCCSAGRSVQGAGPLAKRRGAEFGYPTGLGRELPGLRGAESLAAVAAGRHRCGTLHGGPAASATATTTPWPRRSADHLPSGVGVGAIAERPSFNRAAQQHHEIAEALTLDLHMVAGRLGRPLRIVGEQRLHHRLVLGQ
ncbi:hypothetical protein SAMN02982994_6597 [Azospirillum lipoferum]|nr:hypothetical protein SAMN02982994_6597 [Azospirillum lipoferum]